MRQLVAKRYDVDSERGTRLKRTDGFQVQPEMRNCVSVIGDRGRR